MTWTRSPQPTREQRIAERRSKKAAEPEPAPAPKKKGRKA